jgi:hypothetical protein
MAGRSGPRSAISELLTPGQSDRPGRPRSHPDRVVELVDAVLGQLLNLGSTRGHHDRRKEAAERGHRPAHPARLGLRQRDLGQHLAGRFLRVLLILRLSGGCVVDGLVIAIAERLLGEVGADMGNMVDATDQPVRRAGKLNRGSLWCSNASHH